MIKYLLSGRQRSDEPMRGRIGVGLVVLGLVIGAGTGALANARGATSHSHELVSLDCLHGLVADGSFLWADDVSGFETAEEAVLSYLRHARGEENVEEFALERTASGAHDSDVAVITVKVSGGPIAQAGVERNPSGGYLLETFRHCTFLDEQRVFYASDQPFIENAFLEDER